MPITDLLERNSKLYGEETALVELNPEELEAQFVSWEEYELIQPAQGAPYRREISWGVFDEKANRCANMLMNYGIKKGQKVAVLLMNCLDWLPVYFGILKTGAIAVPLNFRYTAEEISYCLDKSQADVLFFGPEFVERVQQLLPGISENRLLIYVGEQRVSFAQDYHIATANCSSRAPRVLVEDDDDGAIYFSSGTTGFPKAILLKHSALTHSAKQEAMHHETTKDDVFLCIPPLYHTGAKMHWFGSLYTGGKAVLLKGVSPRAIFEAVSSEACSIVWLLVPWCQDILAALDRGELKMSDYNLERLRLMHIGAQPVPPSLIKHWKSYFPHHKYDTNYGLSESAGPGCVHLGVSNLHKVGAIGKPGFGWQCKIVDETGAVVPQGEVGELCVKGPGLMVCYFRDEQATKASLKDGWLHTGDMAKCDSDGFYFLVDRKKDVIISGGENLYPVQIEEFLAANPKIHDVAVIGVPDKRLGEIAAAVIQLKEGMQCSEDEINEFCSALPKYKRPRKIIFAPVPRNPTGKIEKPKLREAYCGVRLVEAQNMG